MCRACGDTPDGSGRRCNRPDGFTPVESDQRNRLRNLANARDALNKGNPQEAANALAHALAAQRALDGGSGVPIGDPTPTKEPHRDFTVNPSDLDKAKARIEALNKKREQSGRGPMTMEVTRQHKPIPGDPIVAWEQATVRVSGATEEELAKTTLGSDVRDAAEKRVRTLAVLETAAAATRINGGVYASRQEAGENSVPAVVDAYIADAPDGSVRKVLAPTAQDREMAIKVRMWVRGQPATSEYIQSVRHSVAEDYMSMRHVGTASSAISGYLRHEERMAKHTAEHGVAPISPRVTGSRWLNKPGDKIILTARVERVVPVYHENRALPRYLHIMRTPDGDLVRWMAPETQGIAEGDDVTVKATVKGHSTFNGEKQTEVYYAQAPRIHPKSA